MLPDFPEIKNKIANVLTDNLRRTMAQKLGFIGEIPKSIVFEGNRSLLIRDDGTFQETPYRLISSTITISDDEVKQVPNGVLLEKMHQAATELASQQTRMAFETLDEEISKAGNSLDAKNNPFTAELFLDGLEKLQIDFDWATQRPILPSIVVHPSNMEKMSAALSKLEHDPVCKHRFESIIEKKKDEWIARESNRKLVG